MEAQAVSCNNSDSPWLREAPTELVYKLAPHNPTFLRSNQIINQHVNKSNIRTNPMTIPTQANSLCAYIQCVQAQGEFECKTEETKSKIQKVHRKANRTLQGHLKDRRDEEEAISQQIKQIETMTDQLNCKASDIMYGRSNNTFYRKGTDLIAKSAADLKKLKNSTSDGCLRKVESTRKLMQKRSIREKEKVIMATVDRSLSNDELSDSINSSSLLDSSQMITKIMKKNEKVNTLKKLLQANSFDSVFEAKRREECKKAFGLHWQQGSANKKAQSSSIFAEKEQRNQNRGMKKQRKTFDESVWSKLAKEDNCEFLLHKRYHEAFRSASSLKLVSA